MVYFSNGQITIRNMECKDAQAITDAEIEQGWDATIEKYQKRLGDQQSGKAISLVAEYSGKPVGYINMVLVKKRVGKYSIIYTASKLCVAMSFTV